MGWFVDSAFRILHSGVIALSLFALCACGKSSGYEALSQVPVSSQGEANNERTVSSVKVDRAFIINWLKAGVPYQALKNATAFLEKDMQGLITNHEHLTIIDFTSASSLQRMYLLNLKSGEVDRFLVSHGSQNGGLKATDFENSNEIGSHKSLPGFHRYAEPYAGQHGVSYRLDGLEDRNSNARRKNVVMHAARYASFEWILKYGWLGRSQGCPAVSPKTMKQLLDKKLSGSLIYNFTILDTVFDAKPRYEK